MGGDELDVEVLVTAIMGDLKFAVKNKQEMVMDQIEIFRRGFPIFPSSLSARKSWTRYSTINLKT